MYQLIYASYLDVRYYCVFIRSYISSPLPGGPAWGMRLNAPVERHHLDGRLGGFGALVAEPPSGAVECLLLVEHGEHSEYHRYVTLGIEVRDPLGDT